MKQTLSHFYSASGAPSPSRFKEFKHLLFANGTTPAIVVDEAVATGVTVSGATTTGVLVSGASTTGVSVTGNATNAFAVATGTFTYGLNVGGTTTTGIAVGASTTGILLTGTKTTGISMTGAVTTGISIAAVCSGAGIDFGSASVTTGSLIDYTGIVGKVSGYLFNGSLTTSTLTASTLLDDCACSCAHDGLAADTLRMIRRTWTGALPNGTAAADFIVAEFAYSGTAGTDKTKTGAVTGVKIDLGSCTLNDDNLTAYGLYVDTTATATKSAAVHGVYITSTEFGLTLGTCSQGIKLGSSGGATSASGLLMGIGTSANPATTSVAAANFVEICCQTTATSGGGRGVYVRYDAAAYGTATGEAIRGALYVTSAVGSFTGVSGGVEFDNTTGAISGSATGGSFTMLINAAGQSTGGLYGASAIMHMGGTGGVPTMHAPLEIRVAGNATGAAKVLNAISFSVADCADSGGGEMISPGTNMGTVTGTIRVLINGTARFIPYYSSEGHA